MAEIEKFHHYEVLRRDDGSLYELGRGAMGITYKAFDTNLRCTVALKVINGTYLNSEVARQRFVREARAAARLSHPNVAAVFHLGEDVNSYFYAMEFIAGETVEGRVKRIGPLSALAALEITLQVAKALRAAEREGLVHRDIKPANLMLISDEEEGDTFVKVIDFGLAKSAVKEAGDATVTIAGFVGTPHFASPEQLEEHELDVRSDIYALGITLWWMLTGKPPFSGALAGIMRDHLSKPPPFDVLVGQPPEVVTLLRRMLEKEPGKRQQNATELRREIESAIKTVAAADGFATKVIGLAAEGPDVFATQALTASTTAATVGASTMSSAPSPTVGVVLSRRYRLLRDCGDRATGKLFQALDLDHNRLVAVKVLHHALLAAPEAQARLERVVAAAQATAHPGLIAVHSFERTPEGHAILVSEWVNGFSLLDLLRGRSRLPANEVVRVAEPIAAATDFAATNNLDSLELSLDQVLLGFEVDYEVGPHPEFVTSPMTEWPPFVPKLSAVALTTGNDPGTYLPEQTMIAASGPGSGDSGGAADFPRRVAMICFELLSGSPPPATTAGGPIRIAPLPSLTEDGNNVLRRGLAVNGYKTAVNFIQALKSGGGASAAPSSRSAPPTVVPPQPAFAAKSPAVIPSKAPAVTGPPSKPPIIPILIGVGVVVIGGLAYYFLAGKKSAEPGPGITPTPVVVVATPVPAATPAVTPIVTAPPTQVVVAPTPKPSGTPAPSRRERFQAALEEARKTESGSPLEQLNAYLKLAEEFPEQDQGLSRLDSVIANLIATVKTPEDRAKRFRQVKNQLDRAGYLGSESALMFLGEQVEPTDAGAAADYYKRAAEKGNTRAMVALGSLLFKGGPNLTASPNETSRWYRAASDKGDSIGKVLLAECYRYGKGGVAMDYFQSVTLLNEALALEPNDSKALDALAQAYERGQGVKLDTRKAFELMQRAADLGNPNAMGNLGTFYMRGVGMTRPDPAKAVQLFKQGADLDNGASMLFYAQCLETGQGVRKDQQEARNYYRAAAERGILPAMRWCDQNGVTYTRQ
jgi:serine/threonine protein kinase/TPR repeat protein